MPDTITLAQFIKQRGITITVEPNPDNARITDWGADALHFLVTLHLADRSLTVPFSGGALAFSRSGGVPTVADVLDCLASDAATVEDGPTFAEWADELGYDPDSRKAEATYNACREQTERLVEFLGGPDGLDALVYGTDTPAPAGRCPFEAEHIYDDGTESAPAAPAGPSRPAGEDSGQSEAKFPANLAPGTMEAVAFPATGPAYRLSEPIYLTADERSCLLAALALALTVWEHVGQDDYPHDLDTSALADKLAPMPDEKPLIPPALADYARSIGHPEASEVPWPTSQDDGPPWLRDDDGDDGYHPADRVPYGPDDDPYDTARAAADVEGYDR